MVRQYIDSHVFTFVHRYPFSVIQAVEQSDEFITVIQ